MEIERRQGASVAEIFGERGEAGFRALEVALTQAEAEEMARERVRFMEGARQSGIDTDLFRDNWKMTNVSERMVVTGGVFAGDVDDDGLEDLLKRMDQ